MSNITGASLTPIYERLNDADAYHPFNVDTFSDWAVEAGDIVTVSRGDTDYQSPVHSVKMLWRGTPNTTLNSVGKEERGPVARMSARKRVSGKQIVDKIGVTTRTYSQPTAPTGTDDQPLKEGDVWIQSSFLRTWDDAESFKWTEIEGYTWDQMKGSKVYVRKDGQWKLSVDEQSIAKDADFEKTKDYVRLYATDLKATQKGLQGDIAQIKVEAKQITSTVQDTKNDLSSMIKQTAGKIRSEVTDKTNNLSSSITQTANRVAIVVDGGGNIKAAQIVAAINDGSSSVYISANHIDLDGYVKATDITANFIAGVLVNSTVLSTSYMFTKQLEIGTSGAIVNGFSCALEDGIKALQLVPNGDTYTLQKKHFYSENWENVGSFSRATTLTGAWSDGTLTVTASPQGTVYTLSLSGSPSWSGGTCTIPIKYTINGTNYYDTGKNVYAYVNASNITASNFVKNYTGSISGWTNLGSVNKSSLSANTYMYFKISVHGRTKTFYITVNA